MADCSFILKSESGARSSKTIAMAFLQTYNREHIFITYIVLTSCLTLMIWYLNLISVGIAFTLLSITLWWAPHNQYCKMMMFCCKVGCFPECVTSALPSLPGFSTHNEVSVFLTTLLCDLMIQSLSTLFNSTVVSSEISVTYLYFFILSFKVLMNLTT